MAGEQLRVSEGEEPGKLFSVEAALLIGRRASEDHGNLGGDPEISRRHARVVRGADGKLTIEDLGSANGTFVNGERIEAPRMLRVGDLIRVGKTILEVTDGPGVTPDTSGLSAAAPEGGPPDVAAEPAAVFVVTAGNELGRRLALSDELVVGRGVGGEGRLSQDPEVSRRHARFVREAGGQLSVEDLESANGTFVNGERVRGRQVLRPGDSVRVGATTLQLADAGQAAQSPEGAAPPPPSAAERRPAHKPSAPPVPTGDRGRPRSELPSGSVFAGCRVEEVIGRGQMGVVYRATELALQRLVALKLIVPEFSGEERFRERFRRESRIAAAIDHPNVIPIFDAGDEDGLLYIMMRLVEGTDLRAVIAAEGSIDPLRAARIVGQVGAALDAAHARGMLHRDVKSSNVLLARGDHVYLTDFGLAKRAASTDRLTRQGTVIAQLEYIAPEQILNRQVDARADIYALGCLLFETLTAEAPFARWADGPDALAQIDAPPPSIRDVRPDLPSELDDAVRRAMAKDPSERYPSAGDLGQAALVAAGGLRRARAWSMVATGEAAPSPDDQLGRPLDPAAPAAEVADGGRPKHADILRWAIALAGLVVVAVGMVAALRGISTL
jgi:pSer/pThr/pTyr-binding forkhead associated (FHA) protein